jgi:DNA-binding response OmpR family regulator
MSRNGNHRLTFLIVEVEPHNGLSTRKLLLESAKHNVITAYSAKEGAEMFHRFPRVDVVCVEADLPDLEKSGLVDDVREHSGKIPVIALTPRIAATCKWANHVVNSHDPQALLKCLEKLGGRTDI